MIDQIDDHLIAWVKATLGGITPTLTAPTSGDGARGVNLYLLDLVNDPLRQHTQRPRVQPALRYLVTTSDPDPKAAHRLLGALVFAALEHEEFEVELDPAPAQLWQAFNLAPQPSFLLRVPLPHERVPVELPLVRQPAAAEEVTTTIFYGLLLGPESIPLAGARIELPALARATSTDGQGRFQFVGLPVAPHPKRFHILARGRTLDLSVTETGTPAAPVIITFDLFKQEER